MGQFAQGVVEYEQQLKRCIVARATEHFDEDDTAAFERLLAGGRNATIRNLLGASAPGDKALRLHRDRGCTCFRARP